MNTPEPEEVIEAKAVALLAAALATAGTTIPVQGALAPVLDGAVKQSSDSFVSVLVDQSSQLADIRRSPAAWTLRVAVHISMADDPAGTLFSTICRAVRACLSSAFGDGCYLLSDASAGFRCDALVLDNTETPLDFGNEEEAFVKIYNATVTGRYTPPKES